MLSIEGLIVAGDKPYRGRIEIDQSSGLITKISSPTGTADIVLHEELIFPGFIDLHVHAREDTSHTQEYKEDFQTAGAAAINGGIVLYGDMPNNPIPPVDDASYDAKRALADKSPIPIFLYAGIGPNTMPLSKKVPYKVFMGRSIGDMFFTSHEGLEEAIVKYRGANISFHCEDPIIMEEASGGSTHESRRPVEAELSAVDIALALIEKYELKGKICHCSTIGGIQKIVDAKKRGVQVTVEVTPHHLFFDETMLEDTKRTLFQVNPPIRQTKENRLGLIEMLRTGDIDYLATDHAPHTKEEKMKGISGLTHLDTYGAFTTWLCKEHNFTVEDIKRICSSNPANFVNKFVTDIYGEIKEGSIGSLSIIDMQKPITIQSSDLKTKNGWSPFLGMEFPGNCVITIIKGKVYAK